MATYCKENGPVTIGVDASKWQSYRSGILTNCGGSDLDHGVTIVGYESGSYWKIKNSWGKSWGEAGYIRVNRGVNCCGVKDDPWSAKVAKCDATRYHCDKDSGKCVEACEGHSTMALCQDACN